MSNNLKARDKIVSNYLELKPSDTLLSIGCKIASFERLILDQVQSITAFDIQTKIINKNIRRFSGISKIKFAYGDITQTTPYPSDSFDKVILLEVIEHVPKRTELKVLQEIYRLLKKGGVLVLSTPNKHWLSDCTDWAHLLGVHRHYTLHDMATLCRQAGFAVEREEVVGGFWSTIWISARMILRIFQLHFLVRFIDNKIMEDVKDKEYSRPGFLNIFIKCRK
jgi:2-polyprenyl-3-methyl-5-hydroxy-6-metoxy-1,4-benzoquinol methylase